MDEKVNTSNFDPVLRAALKEMENICKKYDIGGMVCLTSKSHAEYKMIIPSWSLFGFSGKNGDRGVLKVRLQDSDRMNSTMHFILCVRDICGLIFSNLDQVFNSAKEHMQIEHKPFGRQ